MTLPVKGGRITAPYNDIRPLGAAASSAALHLHGALDIAGGDGFVRAPTDGVATGYIIFRSSPSGSWSQQDKPEILALPWRDYWQDIYGGIVSLRDHLGRIHILAHFWPRSLLHGGGQYPFQFDRYVESALPGRFPHHMLISSPAHVREGQTLAKIGNAGYSTGAHCHWEIHPHTDRLSPYAERIDPETLL